MLNWQPGGDNVGIHHYNVYRGSSTRPGQTKVGETTALSYTYTGLYAASTTLELVAEDAAGSTSTLAEAIWYRCAPPAARPHPTPAADTVTQAIAEGSTLGYWSPGVPCRPQRRQRQDDPGSVRFLVDGNVVLTSRACRSVTQPASGLPALLQTVVSRSRSRAISDTGTVVATNTVTASIANDMSSPPPPPPPPPAWWLVASVVAEQPARRLGHRNRRHDRLERGDRQRRCCRLRPVPRYQARRANPADHRQLRRHEPWTAYLVGVDAYDAAGTCSARVNLSVTTAPCPDSQPPSAPTNVTASNRTTTSIALTWAPATDNVGVAGYGIYKAGELVNTTTGTTGIVAGLICGTNYTLAVDAFDGSGTPRPRPP